MKEAEALVAAAVEEKIRAKTERKKWHTTSRKFFDFVGFASDVVTKAKLYDQCMKKSEVVPAPKILRMLVDLSGRVENLIKELHVFLQYDRRGQEAEPSEQCPELDPEPASRSEPTSLLTSTPGAPMIREPSAPIPRPEAP